jgi:hypothetical protein
VQDRVRYLHEIMPEKIAGRRFSEFNREKTNSFRTSSRPELICVNHIKWHIDPLGYLLRFRAKQRPPNASLQ